MSAFEMIVVLLVWAGAAVIVSVALGAAFHDCRTPNEQREAYPCVWASREDH